MFSDIPLLGTKPHGIPLATRKGTPIENQTGVAASEDAEDKNTLVQRIHGKEWTPRTGPVVSGYNCAGHVWATRRTSVYIDNKLLDTILEDDGYEQLAEGAKPLPGDLALYRLKDLKLIHVGQVHRIVAEGKLFVVMVLSKWDDTSGEYIHKAWDVPFRKAFPDCELRYWTERFRRPL